MKMAVQGEGENVLQILEGDAVEVGKIYDDYSWVIIKMFARPECSPDETGPCICRSRLFLELYPGIAL